MQPDHNQLQQQEPPQQSAMAEAGAPPPPRDPPHNTEHRGSFPPDLPQHPQQHPQQLPAVRDLAGRVALVTGATSGLGLEAAAALAGRGATVLFGARNPGKAARVAAEIRARFAPGADLDLVLPAEQWPAQPDTATCQDDRSCNSGNGGGRCRRRRLYVPPLDLADPASICRFAAALLGPAPAPAVEPVPAAEPAPSHLAPDKTGAERAGAEAAAPGDVWVDGGDGGGGDGSGAAAGTDVWRLPLHILINNAGTSLLPPGPRSGVTDWGVNGLAQVNYLGAYQLTRLLAPKLLEGVRAEAAAAAAAEAEAAEAEATAAAAEAEAETEAAATPQATSGRSAGANTANAATSATGATGTTAGTTAGSPTTASRSRVAGRVVAVSSVTHRCYELPADPRLFLHSTSHMTYAWTKSANVLFAYELQRRLGAYGIQSCAVDPGGVRTSIWDEVPALAVPPAKWVIEALYAPPADGAAVLVEAATRPWDQDLSPRVPAPAADLRFYARGSFASPALTLVEAPWRVWWRVAAPSLYGTTVVAHSLADYPVRRWSGGRLFNATMPVRSAAQTYDGALAAALWRYSAQLVDTITAAAAAAAAGDAADEPAPSAASGLASAKAAGRGVWPGGGGGGADEGFTFAQPTPPPQAPGSGPGGPSGPEPGGAGAYDSPQATPTRKRAVMSPLQPQFGFSPGFPGAGGLAAAAGSGGAASAMSPPPPPAPAGGGGGGEAHHRHGSASRRRLVVASHGRGGEAGGAEGPAAAEGEEAAHDAAAAASPPPGGGRVWGSNAPSPAPSPAPLAVAVAVPPPPQSLKHVADEHGIVLPGPTNDNTSTAVSSSPAGQAAHEAAADASSAEGGLAAAPAPAGVMPLVPSFDNQGAAATSQRTDSLPPPPPLKRPHTTPAAAVATAATAAGGGSGSAMTAGGPPPPEASRQQRGEGTGPPPQPAPQSTPGARTEPAPAPHALAPSEPSASPAGPPAAAAAAAAAAAQTGGGGGGGKKKRGSRGGSSGGSEGGGGGAKEPTPSNAPIPTPAPIPVAERPAAAGGSGRGGGVSVSAGAADDGGGGPKPGAAGKAGTASAGGAAKPKQSKNRRH
ncbi:hypothetical protein HXX76_012183 [Chlamydomonas incerta]|uniref:Uncharacterized protein n=1 Tax=Chlamydomonas incerta TaxID=51695 RepID=A0A835SQG4_CHLIN|nr:hypothetical protein HXX76_012183 [Chlamydomonas incerta]|eukprot:KAG2427863.1 hypothetical protein HXX76_012183 [Chlamydomonas incerta]